MMVGTPRPGSPTRTAQVPSNSTSDEAFDLLPSLFFSRWTRMVLRVPSGSTRGTRKQVSPASAWARTRKASDCGAEKNHLWPVSRWARPPGSEAVGTARVVLARTSEPPCFSVIPMPKVSPDFSPGAIVRGSYERLSSPGSQSRPTSGSRCRTGTTACDMDIGQA